MSPFENPYILLDFNLLLWMPDIQVPTTPTGFDRAEEQQAFSELLDMRSRKEIEIGIPDKWPKSIVTQIQQKPEIKQKVASFFNKRISKSHTSITEGSDLEDMENRALEQILTTVPSNKNHDDPAIFILADFIKPKVTHLATCDMGFIKKIDTYDRGLLKDKEVEKYRKFRRRNKKLIVNLPSKILRGLKSKTY